MKELSIFTIPDDVSDEYSVYVGNIDSDKIIKIIETFFRSKNELSFFFCNERKSIFLSISIL